MIAEDSDETIERYSSYLRALLSALTTVLALLFVWLKFRGDAVLMVFQSAEALLIVKIAMAIYFVSWCAGADFDIRLRRRILTFAPRASSFAWLFPLYVGLAVGFGVMCFVIDTASEFALLLLAFWTLNAFGWLRAKKGIFREVFPSSQGSLDSTRFALVKAVERYDIGAWQVRRFVVGAVLIFVTNLTAWLTDWFHVRHVFGTPSELAVALCVLSFVVFVEGWMWWERSRMHFAESTIKWLAKSFQVAAVAASESGRSA